MNFYSGIRFIQWDSIPRYSWWIDKYFAGYYTIQFNSAGRLHLRLGGNPAITLNAPVAWLTFPGVHFQYGSRHGGHWAHQYVAFSGSRVTSYIRSGLFPMDRRPPVIPIVHPVRFHTAFDELMACLKIVPLHMPRAVYLLEGLLLQLHEQTAPSKPDSAVNQAIRQLAEAIEREPTQYWDFEEESRKMHVSYHYLRRIFQRRIGLPPQQYVIQHRLTKAAALLRQTDQPIKVVAEQAGIHDVNYFSKLFRARFHLAPGRYRQEFYISGNLPKSSH